METGIKDFARPVEASAIKELLPSRPPRTRPRRAHTRRGHSPGPAQHARPAAGGTGELPDDRAGNRLPESFDRGRVRHLGRGRTRRRDAARLQSRLGRLAGQSRTDPLDTRVQRGASGRRSCPLRRYGRPPGDHRRRKPAPGPHRAARPPGRPRRRGPAALHGGQARRAARRRRALDRPGGHDGPVPVHRPHTASARTAPARGRHGDPAGDAGAAPGRSVLTGRPGPRASVRTHRRRPAALPLLDGGHVTGPHGPPARHAGRDHGRQPPRPRRTRPGAGLRPQQSPAAGEGAPRMWVTRGWSGGAPEPW
ncbi:hypothetical protein STENM223S_00004 [Streptomyces tendae]